MNRLSSLLYITYFSFALQYRKTIVGPLWVVMGPTLFITTLGLLFARVGGADLEIFLPHLTVGLISWTLMSGFVIGSTTVFRRAKAQIMQGGMSIVDIVTVDVCRTVVIFLHQVIIVVVVFYLHDIPYTMSSLLALVGLLLLIANGAWLTMLFGMLGARYRDLQEVITAIMRIAFLATPILWMPSSTGRGGVMSAFLTYNPFYHFLEIVRAPLLGNPIAPESWTVALSVTALGFLVTYLFYNRVVMRIALWV
jgi:ABC-2 type transport system permease protein/lipopolysaccharide transport system permease protein